MTASQNLLPVYQTLDLPLKSILNEVHENRWVLPAIQREFVWDDDQICRLFDSMMRGDVVEVKEVRSASGTK